MLNNGIGQNFFNKVKQIIYKNFLAPDEEMIED